MEALPQTPPDHHHVELLILEGLNANYPLKALDEGPCPSHHADDDSRDVRDKHQPMAQSCHEVIFLWPDCRLDAHLREPDDLWRPLSDILLDR